MCLRTSIKIMEVSFMIKTGMLESPTDIITFRRDPVHIVQEEGWAPRPVFYWCEKFFPHRDSIPVVSSPYKIAIPSVLSRSKFGFNFRLSLTSCFILCVINYYEKRFSIKKPPNDTNFHYATFPFASFTIF
jgi:hypothetical protein